VEARSEREKGGKEGGKRTTSLTGNSGIVSSISMMRSERRSVKELKSLKEVRKSGSWTREGGISHIVATACLEVICRRGRCLRRCEITSLPLPLNPPNTK
jgi:hypothetical protein